MNKDHDHTTLTLLLILGLTIMFAALVVAWMRIGWLATLAVLAGEAATLGTVATLHELREKQLDAEFEGETIRLVCPGCGAEWYTRQNPAKFKYCADCGSKLEIHEKEEEAR